MKSPALSNNSVDFHGRQNSKIPKNISARQTNEGNEVMQHLRNAE